MRELSLHESFQNGEYIEEKDIKKVLNYITGNLISCSPNRSYWHTQYNYATKVYHVCRWRKKRGFRPIAKKGENICNDELVNIFNEHKNCVCSVA